MKRKHLLNFITYGPGLLLALAASLLCQWFGLAVWQTCLVTIPLGVATYWGVGSPLADRYMVWSLDRGWKREQEKVMIDVIGKK
ncbi:hypothetical protein R75461_07256 [Paraburkholderia nemoris]|uniref:hypothetical protein n=1 Tax=Paraburkholderia nemoris TaxID=2793076 RepID=UPI00190C22C7|nr:MULTISPECIES: hypothetical protein [Paraburkholderia]MBK3786089.1 hypothetical protein [Paraburkholderia aspalathi]CAE6846257.1 hypothetical protein R75461_07256 [Paraburkholderia nemoris]